MTKDNYVSFTSRRSARATEIVVSQTTMDIHDSHYLSLEVAYEVKRLTCLAPGGGWQRVDTVSYTLRYYVLQIWRKRGTIPVVR